MSERVYRVAVRRSAPVPGLSIPGEKPALYLGRSRDGGTRLVSTRSAASTWLSFAAAQFAAEMCVGGYVVPEIE